MMWKESYKIGVESIDKQHKALFCAVDDLLKEIKEKADKTAFQKTIQFLKEYVVYHFSEEEAYQASIGYAGLKEHQKLHQEFTSAILAYEKKLLDTDFSLSVVKDLAGTLTTWLIYHVAGEDQNFVQKNKPLTEDKKQTMIESFSNGMIHVLETMANLNAQTIKNHSLDIQKIFGDIFIKIGIIGDMEGVAVFGFSKELAFNLVELMTSIRPEEVDEFIYSALSELANITSGNVTIQFAAKNLHCDITTPEIVADAKEINQSLEGTTIDTGIGGLDVLVNIHKTSAFNQP